MIFSVPSVAGRRFRAGLELGAGNGLQSAVIVDHCDHLICTDLVSDSYAEVGKSLLERHHEQSRSKNAMRKILATLRTGSSILSIPAMCSSTLVTCQTRCKKSAEFSLTMDWRCMQCRAGIGRFSIQSSSSSAGAGRLFTALAPRTFKSSSDLERTGGRTHSGVMALKYWKSQECLSISASVMGSELLSWETGWVLHRRICSSFKRRNAEHSNLRSVHYMCIRLPI